MPMTAETLESVLREKRRFGPPAGFAEQANLPPEAHGPLAAKADADPDAFWRDLAQRHLHWRTPFQEVLDESDPPFFRWFTGGRLNVAENCLDVHLGTAARHKAALVWEGEDGEVRTLTYAQLHREVCRFANVLRDLGVRAGDRVMVYLPMVPEVAVTMLACARIGAVHSVVFAGFSSSSLAERLADTQAKVLVTADGGYRNGRVVPLKDHADVALERAGDAVEHVVLLRRTGRNVPMRQGRDRDWSLLMQEASADCPAEPFDAEHPLYILYTSGSTGKPKGIVHSSGGYLLWAKLTCLWVFDLKPEDVYWCTADVGWVTGHTYVVYGPLAAGATVLMYEGAPMHPEPDRLWAIVERHGVNVFYTAPTAIRASMRAGDDWPRRHDLSTLRLLGTVGEPINPEAWMWYHERIGTGRCPIVDTWWQTETGGIMMSPLPGVHATKPGSCIGPLPGIRPDIVDEHGDTVEDPEKGGYLVLKRPWPSMLRTLWGNDERYVQQYWSRFGKTTYLAGDTAHRDEDGGYWILGRFDDVLNVSGHRLGTMEIESALVSHPRVAEAAVVGRPHEVKGEAVCAFVVLRGGTEGDGALETELREHVGEAIGPIAKPDDIRFTPALPKTRSGKIMRRLLRAIAREEDIEQDISTLENEDVVKALRG